MKIPQSVSQAMSGLKIKVLLLMGCALLGASPAEAVLLYYEGFGYSSGQNVSGQSGGSGFSNNWSTTAAGVTPEATGTVTATGLTYTGLSTSGLAAQDSSTGARQGNTRTWTAPGGTFNDGNSIWMSALVNIPTTNAGSDLRVFGLAGSTDFGNGGGYGFVISSDASAIRASFNGNNVNSAASLTGSLNTTMLIVSQLSIVSGVDTVTVWLNPTLSTLPTTGGVSVTGTFSTPGTLYGGFRGGTAFSGIVDELRVGTSYFDVVPTTVPEPSTYTLMGLGLGALWVLRCRKAA